MLLSENENKHLKLYNNLKCFSNCEEIYSALKKIVSKYKNVTIKSSLLY